MDLLEAGHTPEEIADDYPDLTLEDIEAASEFATQEKMRIEARTRGH
jgi:uncharacterized protein (DUF433 family)